MASHGTTTTTTNTSNTAERKPRRGAGFDMSERQHRNQHRNERREQNKAERALDGQRKEAEVDSYLRALAQEYLKRDGSGDDAADLTKSRRPRPVAFAGSGLRRTAAARPEGVQYRSNEEALPSRAGWGGDRNRNRSPKRKNKGKGKQEGEGGKGAAPKPKRAVAPAPEFDATALSFGPSLAPAAAPALPKIWGPGMPKPAPAPKLEPITEVIPTGPTTPDGPPPAAIAGVWGDESDDDDDDDAADAAPLAAGQAWGDMA